MTVLQRMVAASHGTCYDALLPYYQVHTEDNYLPVTDKTGQCFPLYNLISMESSAWRLQNIQFFMMLLNRFKKKKEVLLS